MIKRLKATQVNGKWYVGQGHKIYYPATESETKEEALREAYLWMMHDAYNKCRDIYDEAVAKGLLEEESFGDYLA